MENDLALESNLDKHFLGIEAGLESIDVLMKLHEIIEQTNGSGVESYVSLEASKLAVIAVESVKRNLGIFKDEGLKIGFESFQDKNVALEGIGDIISKIWQAILNTFKYIWDFIASIFNSKKREINTENLEESKEQLENQKIYSKHEREIKADIFVHFSYLNKNITVKDLIKECQNMEKIIHITEETIRALRISSINLAEGIKGFSDNRVKNQHIANINFPLFTMYDHIAKHFDKVTSMDHSVYIEKSHSNMDNIDTQAFYALKGFSDGRYFYTYRQRKDVKYFDDAYILNFHSTAFRGNTNYFSFTFSGKDDAVTYSEEVLKLVKKYDDLQKYMENELDKVRNTNSAIISDIKKAKGKITDDEYLEHIKIANASQKMLSRMVLMVAAIDSCILSTVNDHVRTSTNLNKEISKS